MALGASHFGSGFRAGESRVQTCGPSPGVLGISWMVYRFSGVDEPGKRTFGAWFVCEIAGAA